MRRACFGASTSQIDEFASRTPQEAISILFNSNLADPPLPIDPESGSEWISTGPTGEREDRDLVTFLNRWILGQMLSPDVSSDQQLAYSFRERLVFFLHTHFTTQQSEVNNTRAIYYQNVLFRAFAFDGSDAVVDGQTAERNFKKLTEKVCVDNAMLVFLDGRLNVQGRPNENFARELLELYSIGRGLEGSLPETQSDGDYFHFTEQDVQAGARVLSGFENDGDFGNLDAETGIPRGVIRGSTFANQHDNGVKTFSNRMGNATITANEDLLVGGNAVEESVLDEITQLIDLIYAQDETARHVCRKVYRFFVYHEIDESLEADIVQELADIFTSNGFRLQPVIEAIFTSQHFYDAADGETDNAYGGLIKSPIDLTVGFFRNFNISVPSYTSDLDSFYEFTGDLLSQIGSMGLDFYNPFEVAGYPAYHQFPIYNRSWINTNYLTVRYNFIAGRITAETPAMGQVNAYDFVKANIPDSIASNIDSLIIALAEYFLPASENLSFDNDTSELTVRRLNFFKSRMLFDGSADPEAYWTENWNANTSVADLSRLLSNTINAMLQSPEYQLM